MNRTEQEVNINTAKASRPTFSAIDLFSGCGGLSYGFAQAGIHTKLAVDNWADSLSTYEANHSNSEVMNFDLGSPNLSPLMNHISDTDVVFGGPPCQGFSISGKRNPEDPRNKLYKGFHKIVADLRPKIFVMENVPNLVSMDKGRLIQEIQKDFTDLGYTLKREILLASDFGVPQNRRRLILVGTLSETPFEMPTGITIKEEKKITCRDALSDLSEETLEDGSDYPLEAQNDYQELMRMNSTGVYNHVVSNHSEQTKRIIGLVPDGGNYKDLPREYQDTRKVNIAWTRYASNKPSLTIDTGHRHHFHYEFNRIPTVRESARLQSFPDSFIFKGSRTSQYKQVGNAVPPLLAKAIGLSVIKHIIKTEGPISK